jgi:hypothetical protein
MVRTRGILELPNIDTCLKSDETLKEQHSVKVYSSYACTRLELNVCPVSLPMPSTGSSTPIMAPKRFSMFCCSPADAHVHTYCHQQRLGAESMRQFDACSLCLQRARDPMACPRGHLYCRECVLSDLLTQKKDIKRHQAKLEAMAREEEEQKIQAKAAARERVLMDFERKHLGLALTSQRTAQSKDGATSGTTPTECEALSRTRKLHFT